MKPNWNEIITDERLEKVGNGCDRWSSILGWVAVIATFFLIIIPAVWTILAAEPAPKETPKAHGTIVSDDRGPVLKKAMAEAIRK